MDTKYYAQYEDGTISNSFEDLEDAVKWLTYYRLHHPDKMISIIDEDLYFVPATVLFN